MLLKGVATPDDWKSIILRTLGKPNENFSMFFVYKNMRNAWLEVDMFPIIRYSYEPNTLKGF